MKQLLYYYIIYYNQFLRLILHFFNYIKSVLIYRKRVGKAKESSVLILKNLLISI